MPTAAKMFSVGPILGFRPDFGLSEIYGFWVHFGGVGWAWLGWVGWILLDSELRAAFFGRRLVFRGLWATAGALLGGRKLLFRRVYFGFADLWPRFWVLDVPGGDIGIGIPCPASTVFEDDDDRRRRWPTTTMADDDERP